MRLVRLLCDRVTSFFENACPAVTRPECQYMFDRRWVVDWIAAHGQTTSEMIFRNFCLFLFVNLWACRSGFGQPRATSRFRVCSSFLSLFIPPNLPGVTVPLFLEISLSHLHWEFFLWSSSTSRKFGKTWNYTFCSFWLHCYTLHQLKDLLRKNASELFKWGSRTVLSVPYQWLSVL